MNILIIEDNLGDQILIEESLSRTALPIEKQWVVTDLTQGLEQLKQETVDVVFLDLFLPGFTGLRAVETLNPDGIDAAVIVLTGLSDQKTALDALKHGVQEFLIKGEFDEKLLDKSVRYAVERKRSEMALVQSKERYRILFDSNPVPMWAVHSTDFNILMVNRAAVRHYGYPAEEFSQMNMLDIFLEADRAAIVDVFASLAELPAQPDETKHKKKDGTLIDVELIVQRILLDSQPAILISALDITERLKTQTHLLLLESVITNANDAVLISEIKPGEPDSLNVTYVNAAFTRMTGYSSEEILNKDPFAWWGLQGNSAIESEIYKAWSNGISVDSEILTQRKDGEFFWNNFTLVPVGNDKNQHTHWVSIHRDVTVRKQQEELTRRNLERLVEERTLELHEALAKEKELVEMKSRFVAIASHEFRTPLSTINFIANFLQDNAEKLPVEEIKTKLQRIERQVAHMAALLEDVILVGKSDLKKIQVVKSSIDVRQFIHRIIEEVQNSTKHTHAVKLTYDVAAEHLDLDEKLLRNILINLLSNAIKFSPGKGEVTFNCVQHAETLVIEVQDKGIGIPAGDLKNLFEAFYRGSNVTAIPGSGLGLSIVQKAVELLNGTIDLQSESGKGTAIKIKLPIQ